jgi:hypothetical protein
VTHQGEHHSGWFNRWGEHGGSLAQMVGSNHKRRGYQLPVLGALRRYLKDSPSSYLNTDRSFAFYCVSSVTPHYYPEVVLRAGSRVQTIRCFRSIPPEIRPHHLRFIIHLYPPRRSLRSLCKETDPRNDNVLMLYKE